ncbi:VOC family protein [bacterium]|nr:VOC family protein [bacterium]
MTETAFTFLMFEGHAEHALNLHASVFDSAGRGAVTRHGPEAGALAGAILRAELTIGGHRLVYFDSPPVHNFGFTPAISIFVDLTSADAVDAKAASLMDRGAALMPPGDYGFSKRFAWVKDRFGVTWQLNCA